MTKTTTAALRAALESRGIDPDVIDGADTTSWDEIAATHPGGTIILANIGAAEAARLGVDECHVVQLTYPYEDPDAGPVVIVV